MFPLCNGGDSILLRLAAVVIAATDASVHEWLRNSLRRLGTHSSSPPLPARRGGFSVVRLLSLTRPWFASLSPFRGLRRLSFSFLSSSSKHEGKGQPEMKGFRGTKGMESKAKGVEAEGCPRQASWLAQHSLFSSIRS